MRIVFMGAPGSGKGTQAQRVISHFGIPQISTGDILRKHRKEGTELGKRADAIMAAGKLVDDATMLELIRDRVAQADAQNGFILDGFPRTQAQAEGLTQLMRELGTPLDAVVLFDLGAAELVRRISGRRTCSLCNKVFNIYSAPPSVPATDCVPDSSEHQLFQRKDDEEDTVKERLRVYEENTRPVLSYYSDAGLLRTISAEGSPEEITQRLLAAVEPAVRPARPAKKAKPAPSKKRAAKPAARRRAVTAAKKAKKAVRKPPRRKTARKAKKSALSLNAVRNVRGSVGAAVRKLRAALRKNVGKVARKVARKARAVRRKSKR
jgi:adenylate kinase